MSGLTDTQVDAIASAATSLVAALRAVVDTEAHGGPSPPRSGTSSAGDGGQRSPDAPSTQEEHPPQASLTARIREEQDRADRADRALREWQRHAQEVEANLDSVEAITAAERAVICAAEELVAADVEDRVEDRLDCLDRLGRAVAAMQHARDTEEGQ